MVNRNYKYTLLHKDVTNKCENSDFYNGVIRVFACFTLATIVFVYYASQVSINENASSLMITNLTSPPDGYGASISELQSLETTEEYSVGDFFNSTSTSASPLSTLKNVFQNNISSTEYSKAITKKITMPTQLLTSTISSRMLTPELIIGIKPKYSEVLMTSTTKKHFERITPGKVEPKLLPKPLKITKLLNSKKFYVNTQQCRMPWVDPFAPATKMIFKPGKYSDCSKKKALINSNFNETQRRYILHINSTNVEDLVCCYQQIVRAGSGADADRNFNLLPCTNFHQDFVVPRHIDSMIVKCSSRSTKKLIQKDAFSFIQDKERPSVLISTADRLRKPSVLLIGIDSLSRFNFRRNMPRTANFFVENNWLELQGYNKVGDNTFPNLMPLLTGLNESMAYSRCKPKTVGGLDNCNFIWKDFKANGYWTAYAEDEVSMSTFNYIKKGFNKAPTDYYLRPMMLAIERNIEVVKKAGLKYCIGRRHAGGYIYDFGLEFVRRYRNDSAFGLFWTNSFSHNSYDTSSTMDVKMLEYMERLKSDETLESAIVVFFSDHGCRWGPLLRLPDGFLEERLPMFFMSFPKWFHKTYPEYIKALKINMNRLTTPFDIYQTFKHILELNRKHKDPPKPALSCEKAQSVFYEIPENRTCADACIPEHWCTCEPYEILSKNSPEVQEVTDLVVAEINNYLKSNNFSSLCSVLKTDSISVAEVKLEHPGKKSNTETLRIKFKVQPKKAEFQATAVYDLEKHKIHVVIEEISRLDSYENHSKCIDNKLAKKFCICKK